MKYTKCNLCGSNVEKLLFYKDDLRIVKCLSCGLVRLNPQLSEEIEKLYNESYYESWGLIENKDIIRKMKKTTFNKRLNLIEKYSRKGKILDIGCATGFSLEVAMERGWDAYGVEISDYSSRLAKETFGSRVSTGTLEEAKYEDNFFDVVTMFDLIEHVSDPTGLLRKVAKITKKDGILCITTANINSLSSFIFHKNWTHIKIEHLYYFSPITISRLLKKSCFEIKHIGTASKAITFSFLFTYFKVFRNSVFTPLTILLNKILPNSLQKKVFFSIGGEMLIIGKKISS